VQHQSWAPFAEELNNMFSHEVLGSIAEKHNKPTAQVVLHWLVQRDVVVIPKSVRTERIVENFDIFDFELSADDMKQISSFDTQESLFPSYHDLKFAKMLGILRVICKPHLFVSPFYNKTPDNTKECLPFTGVLSYVLSFLKWKLKLIIFLRKGLS